LLIEGDERRQKTFGSDDGDPCAWVANFFSRARRRRARLFFVEHGLCFRHVERSTTWHVAASLVVLADRAVPAPVLSAEQRGSLVLVTQQAWMEGASQDGAALALVGVYTFMAFVTERAHKQQAPPAPVCHGTWHPSPSWRRSVDLLLRARTMTALLRARCDFRTKSTAARRGCFCIMNEIVCDLTAALIDYWCSSSASALHVSVLNIPRELLSRHRVPLYPKVGVSRQYFWNLGSV